MTPEAERLINKEIFPDFWMFPPPRNSSLWNVWRRTYGVNFREKKISVAKVNLANLAFSAPSCLPPEEFRLLNQPSANISLLKIKPPVSRNALDSKYIVQEFHSIHRELETFEEYIKDWVNCRFSETPGGIQCEAIRLLCTYFCHELPKSIREGGQIACMQNQIHHSPSSDASYIRRLNYLSRGLVGELWGQFLMSEVF